MLNNKIKVLYKKLNIKKMKFIKLTTKNRLHQTKDLNEFLDNLKPLESLKEIDGIEYMDKIREINFKRKNYWN